MDWAQISPSSPLDVNPRHSAISERVETLHLHQVRRSVEREELSDSPAVQAVPADCHVHLRLVGCCRDDHTNNNKLARLFHYLN